MPNYEDIKWVQGTSGKTKIVKCRFQDQEDAGTTPEDENGIESRGGAAAAPAAGRSLQLRLRLRLRLGPPAHPERWGERD